MTKQCFRVFLLCLFAIVAAVAAVVAPVVTALAVWGVVLVLFLPLRRRPNCARRSSRRILRRVTFAGTPVVPPSPEVIDAEAAEGVMQLEQWLQAGVDRHGLG